MNKKSIWACLLGLSIPAFMASCADLRDADVCYRAARLYCQKACDPKDGDESQCIATQKGYCSNDSGFDEKFYTDCSDKLADLADCAGPDAVAAAVQTCNGGTAPSMPGQYGGQCSNVSECPSDGDCEGGVCVRLCSYDYQCSGVSTSTNQVTYCDDTGTCSPPCFSSSDCAGTLVCHDEGDHKSCRNDSTTMPQPTTKAGLADNCDTSSDCDSTSGLSCMSGFCSKTCRTNADCGSSTSDAICALASGAAPNFCTIPCAGSSSCASGQTCTTLMTVTGSSARGCVTTPATTSPKSLLGGSCKLASDCQDPSLNCQQGVCTKTCTSDLQCGGTTATGSAAHCAALQAGVSLCLSGCTAGVVPCDTGTTCTTVALTTGGSASLCRPNQLTASTGGGNVGDKCTVAGDCKQASGLSCAMGMCTAVCTNGTCPAATSPESAVCLLGQICTATCRTRGCPQGWSCALDENSAELVCQPGAQP